MIPGPATLEQKDNPLRFNNFATNLRELGRIMLDDLSLESSVVNCGWYIPVLNERKKEIITRAQRVKYAVQAGLPDDFVLNTLRVDVGRATQKYTKLIERLSAFTHINATTFGSRGCNRRRSHIGVRSLQNQSPGVSGESV